jgi:hypothetical protein
MALVKGPRTQPGHSFAEALHFGQPAPEAYLPTCHPTSRGPVAGTWWRPAQYLESCDPVYWAERAWQVQLEEESAEGWRKIQQEQTSSDAAGD